MIRKVLMILGLIGAGAARAGQGYENVSAAQAAAMLKDTAVVVLDVRTHEEYAEGHLKNAKLIPVGDLRGRLGELEPLRKKKLLVYCRSGRRSVTASQILSNAGFAVTNMKGGIVAWESERLPVVKGGK